MRSGPKHKLCRRLGACVWGNAKCPSNKRPFSAGQHGSAKGARKKLSSYAQLMLEKQKLRAHYLLSEHQLVYYFNKAKAAPGKTGEKLYRDLEMRLASVVFRSGLTPSIFAARQAVLHRHILVDGKIVNRASFNVKPGMVISINAQHSPALAGMALKTDVVPPPYFAVEKEHAKVTINRDPMPEEIPANIDIMKVVELYAR